MSQITEPRDTGGPAFPVADFDFHTFSPRATGDVRRLLSGMSLRQWYAGLAMQGMLANVNAFPSEQQHFNNLAEDALRMADTLLAAESKP